MLKVQDIGTDEDLAREILVMARSIAPCILGFADESEDLKFALAILRRVYKDSVTRGSQTVKSQRIGSASVEYIVGASFSEERRESLRSLCPAAELSGMPRGSFPPPSKALSSLWPEG